MTTYTEDLETVLLTDPVVGPQFGGVLAVDQLPKKIPEHVRSYVINTDPADKPGTHWVAVYFGKRDDDDQGFTVAEYFDSYGLPPVDQRIIDFIRKNTDFYYHNDRPLQSLYSTVCGQYCVYYLVKRHRGETLEGILDRFTTSKTTNDQAVRSWYNQRYGCLMSRIQDLTQKGGNKRPPTKTGIHQCCSAKVPYGSPDTKLKAGPSHKCTQSKRVKERRPTFHHYDPPKEASTQTLNEGLYSLFNPAVVYGQPEPKFHILSMEIKP